MLTEALKSGVSENQPGAGVGEETERQGPKHPTRETGTRPSEGGTHGLR